MQQLPIISVNGVIGAQISPLDRGFAYGDGVFETCLLHERSIRLWRLHKERLLESCARLFIPVDEETLDAGIKSLIDAVPPSLVDAVIKITITRGEGGRGYRQPTTINPTLVIGVFPLPVFPPHYFSEGISARICHLRLACNSQMAGLKHLNRLEQILARAEWSDEQIAEGILLDINHRVIEAVSSNIFLVKKGKLLTPDLSEAGVAGVMRRHILECIAPRLSLETEITPVYLQDLYLADELFLSNSLWGLVPIQKIYADAEHLYPVGAVTRALQAAITNSIDSINPVER